MVFIVFRSVNGIVASVLRLRTSIAFIFVLRALMLLTTFVRHVISWLLVSVALPSISLVLMTISSSLAFGVQKIKELRSTIRIAIVSMGYRPGVRNVIAYT